MRGAAGKVVLGAAQATPVFMDRAATLDKACALVAEAGRAGARLCAFPEAFIPGYPLWVWALPAGELREWAALHGELVAAAVAVPGPETEALGRAARAAGVNVVLGLNEVETAGSGGTLYNTVVTISAGGELLGRHRKLVPTAGERLVWAQGDGSTLQVHDTDVGKVGALICWENYMPLARYALYAWGTEVYVAATWDRGEPWLSTLRHIAKEGRCFVVGACSAMRLADVPDRFAFKARLKANDEGWINVGDSAVVAPSGEIVAGPSRQKEELVLAEVDLRDAAGLNWNLDVAGHYARPDVFELTVRRGARPLVRESSDPPSQPDLPQTGRRRDVGR
ncbi:MAG TPA: carbon-nitrogen hydrolase family protein [Myxococcota bacterium]|nr:carbon-nitrogen hydrolase family protein [Myxococcota bacterium]